LHTYKAKHINNKWGINYFNLLAHSSFVSIKN